MVVVEVPADNAVTTSVTDAYENITKEHAEKTVYTVQAEMFYQLLPRITDLQYQSY